jgi:TonB-linked SusC/RagA family outer membrane protein
MKKFLLMIFAMSIALGVLAQDRVVTGKVTSVDDKAPLTGVNVVLKGSTSGTVTDSEGKFSLSVPTGGGSLIFSFIGLKSEEVVIGNRAVVDVQLGLDITQLSEIVVTGAGVATDKKRLGIAVESISADKLPATPSASIDQALVGKIAGAQISSISGNPGDPVNIVLRGINTVQGGTKPLILVDGIQVGATDLGSLDLSNIERIEVVQGAASATLYGAQGANGVIQLFTKKGKKGALSINLSSSYSVNEYINYNNNLAKANLHPYLTDANNNIVDGSGNPVQYDQYGNLPGVSYAFASSVAPAASRYAILGLQNVANKPYNGNIKYYDHFKEVFQTGTTTNNNISISGGADKTDFNISISNNNSVTPIMKNGAVDRTNLSVNIGTELFKGFTIRSVTQAIYTKNTMVPQLGASGGVAYGLGNVQADVLGVYGFLNTSPFLDLQFKMADGTYPIKQLGGTYLSVNSANPFYLQEYSTGLGNKVDVIENLSANYKVNKFLELDAKYGMNYRDETARWTYFNQSLNANSNHFAKTHVSRFNSGDNTGEIDNFQYKTTFQNFLASAFIRTDFQEDFHMKLPIQTTTQISFDYRNKHYTELDFYGIGLGLAPPFKITSTAPQGIAQDYESKFVTYGYLINQTIDFGSFGGISGGFRSDWSSAFGQGSTPFTFPRGSAYVLPSSFWKDNGVSQLIPYFKIRAAYGQAGIQPSGAPGTIQAASVQYSSIGQGPYQRIPVLDVGNIGSSQFYSYQIAPNNPNLQVEVSTETEVGTDFTVNANSSGPWFSSINGHLTVWNRTTAGSIFNVSVAPSNGYTGQLTNAIGLESHGTTFSIDLPIYKSSTWTWDFTTNFNRQLSSIKSIQGGADIILTSGAGSSGIVLTPGKPIGQLYGFKALRNINDPEIVASGNPASQYTMVDGRVVDLTTAQIQFSATATPLGNPNPNFNASFINSFGYKGFLTFSFQFDWLNGSHLYNQTKEWMYRDGIHKDFAKPVTIPGFNNDQPGAYTAYWSSAYYNLFGSQFGSGNNQTKDFFYEDNSFWRLRNISVALDLAKVVQMKGFKRVQIVLTGRNLWTKTKYTGADPEVSSGVANSSFDRGIDHNTIPNLKSYQVGLNIGF